MKVANIDKGYLSAHLDEFMGILRQYDYQYWGEEHFLRDLPGKWEHSFAAAADSGDILGYVISSRKGPVLYEHKLYVAPGSQGLGIGKKLLMRTLNSGAERGLNIFELTLYTDNAGAINMYKRYGMAICGATGDNIGARWNMRGNIAIMLDILGDRNG